MFEIIPILKIKVWSIGNYLGARWELFGSEMGFLLDMDPLSSSFENDHSSFLLHFVEKILYYLMHPYPTTQVACHL